MQNEMRDRLIELIVNADTYDTYECKLCTKDDDACDCCYAEKLADYLIERGVILPPCKIGDIVYRNSDFWWIDYGNISAYQITNLTITQNKKGVWTKKYRAMYLLDGKTVDSQLNFEFDDIGKIVFLTKEEAEAKMKEMEK